MRLRKKRCVLVAALWILSFMAWKITSPSNLATEDEAALSALHPNHFAEDSRKGILYHHKFHKGISDFHIANDTWIKSILNPFDNEWDSAMLKKTSVEWSVVDKWASERRLHPPFDPDIPRILKRMSSAIIRRADIYSKGTQLKLLLTLDGQQKVIFKPKWYDNDFVLFGTPYVGKDRHYSEIAGFHLSRLLQFHRTPPVVGRRLHVSNELLPVMTTRLNQTVFYKGNRLCFYGKCYYCKGPSTGVCSDNEGFLDGALILHLPKDYDLTRHPHPWRRTYQKDVKAPWQTNERRYCEEVLKLNPSWRNSNRLLDIIDASIYDFLTGNADRHHYETVGFGISSVVILMDSGKGFGNPYVDETSILAPLAQCCKIRQKTWKRIDELSNISLSEALKRLLQRDPLQPVLSQLHLESLDRRIRIIVAVVHKCIAQKGYKHVLTTSSNVL